MKKFLITTLVLSGLVGLLFAGTANKACPFSGKEITEESKTATIGFCCKNCSGKATKALAAGGKKAQALLAKVTADNKDGDTVNKSCPFSGKAVKATLTVGLCCGKCEAKVKPKS